jgi:hypothetical protein
VKTAGFFLQLFQVFRLVESRGFVSEKYFSRRCQILIAKRQNIFIETSAFFLLIA